MPRARWASTWSSSARADTPCPRDRALGGVAQALVRDSPVPVTVVHHAGLRPASPARDRVTAETGAGGTALVDVRVVDAPTHEIHRRTAGKYAPRSAAPPMAAGATAGTVECSFVEAGRGRGLPPPRGALRWQPSTSSRRIPRRASPAAPSRSQPRYDNFIGGEWRAPVQGEYSENKSPGTGKPFTSVARSTAEDIELALDAAHAAKDAVGRGLAHRARSRPERDRRPNRRKPRDARGRGELGQRQARARDAGGGHPAGRRPLPVLRRRDPRAGGLELGDRPRHGRLPLPRAARRRRPDHPVQLPDPDGRVEGRSRARRRATAPC